MFYWYVKEAGKTPHLDVAAGLIDQNAVGGARAESWISWKGGPGHTEYALSKQMVKALEDGCREFNEVA